jgi:hypothetical protein
VGELLTSPALAGELGLIEHSCGISTWTRLDRSTESA